ncbi:uncharacterized protein LOC126983785 isoform X2 [Eriocheir sinensis]|uniref:uncharacterized protein LOC126983785 isoform X2 n=1 Tax=Eriocheir sinensis TaxID=95602 RepID=UPI0021C5E338|nr:uncharacterized protein LOC126983785 isoform X2 [Eriocheir sinensis]
MTEVPGGVCALCGDDHPAGSCIQTFQLNLQSFQSKTVQYHEPHLAYQSLPSWVEVQEGPGGLQAVVREEVPRLTRLGPLVAPHTPCLPQNTIFPLKICHEGGGLTFLDLSRKWLCNWLSLIPIGSPTTHNLVACQIDDLIYYVSMKDIPAGSGLLVWYAPFYQPKVQKELQEVGSPHSLVGAMVITQKVSRSVQSSAKKSLEEAPSLAKIVVGQGKVTFTHQSVQQVDADGHLPCQLIYLEDECGTGILPNVSCTQLPESPSTFVTQGIAQTKKYLLEGKTIEPYSCQPTQANLRPSIQLASVSEDSPGSECVVRLTVTAAQETGDDQEAGDDQETGDDQEASDDQELLGDDTAEDLQLDLPTSSEGTSKTHANPMLCHKRIYKKLNVHKSGACKRFVQKGPKGGWLYPCGRRSHGWA